MKPLDPLLLGRPLRAVEALAADLAQAVRHCLARGSSRDVDVSLAHASLLPRPSSVASKDIDVALDPRTVLMHMAARYGFAAEELSAPPGTSSTEQRIRAQLRDALARAVGQAIEAACTNAGIAAPVARAADTSDPDRDSGLQWEWRADVAIAGGEAHPLVITLGGPASRGLEQCLAAWRQQLARSGKPAAPAPEAVLQIDLTAQLLELTISAAELQALRPGSVIPVGIGRATALLNGFPMLSATLAEHQGKLHLTAFENLE